MIIGKNGNVVLALYNEARIKVTNDLLPVIRGTRVSPLLNSIAPFHPRGKEQLPNSERIGSRVSRGFWRGRDGHAKADGNFGEGKERNGRPDLFVIESASSNDVESTSPGQSYESERTI